MSDQAEAERRLPGNTPQSQQTVTRVPIGIRTRNPSKRVAEDPRLRPSGHWDRLRFRPHNVFPPKKIPLKR